MCEIQPSTKVINTPLARLPETVLPQRVNGNVRIRLKCEARGKATRLERLYQKGSAKARFPKTFNHTFEAVMINTAGGLTGGDRMRSEINLGCNANAVVTTQSCERIYRSMGDAAYVKTRLNVAQGGKLHWLPQETILFEGSALKRELQVDLAHDAQFVAMEAVVLGRHASGEEVSRAVFHDRWRIRREGKLIHAEDFKLEGDIVSKRKNSAFFNGNRAFATLIFCLPRDDEHLETIGAKVREYFNGKTCSVSAFNGKIITRFLAADSYTLRKDLITSLQILCSQELPKVWRI